MLIARQIEAVGRVAEWERGIGPAEGTAAGPVRVIPVTLAMQEADRLQQRRREQNRTATAWRTKVLGSRAVRTEPKPEPRAVVRTATAAQPSQRRTCVTCPRPTTNASGQCANCRWRLQNPKGAVA